MRRTYRLPIDDDAIATASVEHDLLMALRDAHLKPVLNGSGAFTDFSGCRADAAHRIDDPLGRAFGAAVAIHPPLCTKYSDKRQRIIRTPMCDGIVHTAKMAIKRVSPVAKELKRLRDSARPPLTVREMASEMKMPSHTSYAYYEDGYKKPLLPQEIARKAADVLGKRGVDPAEVLALGGLTLTSDGHKLSVMETDVARVVEVGGSEFARIPVYDIRFAAGAGSENYDEAPIDHYLISLSFLRSMTDAPLDKIAAFQANGDSMEPTINNRDWCLADLRKTKLFNPGIYALVWEGEGLLKRASQHLETRAVTLVSDNKAYEPQTIKKPERLGVVGRVFMSLRVH